MSGAPIAVVGLASLLPGSDDLTGFWQSLVEARDCFSDVPERHWRIEDYFDPTPRAKDKTYGRRGGFIPAQPFDALAFGLPPSSLPSTDVSQLLALLIARRCLADADRGAGDPARSTIAPRFDRRRTSVILGAAATTQLVAHMSGRMAQPMWREGMRRAGMDEAAIDRACAAIAEQFVPWQESTFPGLLGNVIAGRIANRFDLGGTNCVLDAACASSLAALAMAMNELRTGGADTVLTGGVDALNDVLMFLCFSQTPALSLTGDCRPFSDRADGTMLGEGVGMLALRRLEDAERDGHRIYAVIRGLGSSSDGHAKSVYAPRAAGQAMALRRAYEDAGYSAGTVELVEAHGTGTVAGDAAEFAALAEVFGEASPANGPATQWCALGSVKSQIGHTKAAAGAASLVKAILALQHRTLPPTIKVERPNPALELERSPFYLNVTTRPWFHGAAHPRRASVSSFGFGGSNFHVALEEYRGPAAARGLDASPTRLLLFSADDAAGVLAQVATLPDRMRTLADLAACARASHAAFRADAAVRLALVIEQVGDVRAACDEAAAHLNSTGDSATGTFAGHSVVLRRGRAASPATIAFLFPGQGSQYLEMGRDLAVYFPDAFDSWERAIGVLGAGHAEAADLGEVVFPRPTFARDQRDAHEARLRATRWAQPALAAASLAQLALLRRVGLRAAAVAGHSFGELVALHAAGVFDADALLQLARARGEAIEAGGAVHSDSGGMLAVAADAATVQQILDRHGDGRLVIANDNHPRQAVLSGPVESLRQIRSHLSDAALSCQELKVAAAFHSTLVAPAAALFAPDVQRSAVKPPLVPVIANATAQPYPARADAIQAQLTAQLAQPVRFRESIDALYAHGCRIFIEVGAGNVLTGLVGKCLSDRDHVAVAIDNPGSHGLRSWWRAMAEIATLGVPIHLEALHALHGPAASAVFETPGPAVVYVGGANLGKPYPPLETDRKIVSQRPSMPERPVSPAPVVARQDNTGQTDLHQRILEAQRLTQQAILESFSMTLRGMGGAANVTPAALAGVAPVAPALSAPTARVAPLAPLAPVAPIAPVATVAPLAPAVARASSAPPAGRTTAATVLAIIAEKTGYPIEVLAPDMDLEADLGIDSIKRVEILAAVSQQVPSLNPNTVSPADVRRISDLLALLEGSSPDPHQAAAR